jgi:putative inorganic carbon (HCO3(-)) transporter
MINWLLVAFAALAVLGIAIVVVRLSFSYGSAAALRDLTSDGRRWALESGPTTATAGDIRQRSTIHRLAFALAEFELPILALIAPLALFSSRFTVAALAVIPVLWWARWRARGYLLPRTPLDWPIAIMMVMLPVSLLVSFDIGFSLGKAALLIYGVALYYAIVDWARSDRQFSQAVGLYLLGGGLLAALGLLGTDWQHKVPGLTDIVRSLPQVVQGLSRDQTGFHPNIVAGALLWVVLPLLAVTVVAWSEGEPRRYRGRAVRIGLLLLLLLTAGTLVLTQSRFALASAGAGAGLLLWLAVPRLRLWLALLLVLAGVLVAMLGPEQLTGRAGDTPDAQSGTLSDSIIVRVQVWQSALHAIADNPLTGMGLDNFRRLMPFRYPAAPVPDSYDIGHAHNQLLQAAVDLGLPGLVGYLALWLGAALLAAKSYLSSADPWRRALAAGIGAALLASFLHGLTDTVALVSKPGIMFWGLLAIDAALWLQVSAGGITTATSGSEIYGPANEDLDYAISNSTHAIQP